MGKVTERKTCWQSSDGREFTDQQAAIRHHGQSGEGGGEVRTPKPGERHQRKCHDCGNVSMHDDRIVPWVLCTKCGSQDTRPTKGRIIPPQGGASSAPPAKAATVPREVADRLAEVLIRYRKETPLGNQPHMIADEADEALANYWKAVP